MPEITEKEIYCSGILWSPFVCSKLAFGKKEQATQGKTYILLLCIILFGTYLFSPYHAF